MGRILAIDYGRKRTGLAVTDTLRITANPLLTIPTNDLINWLSEYFVKEPVDEVVIGHPTQMNGQESESMNYIRPFLGVFRKTLPDKPVRACNSYTFHGVTYDDDAGKTKQWLTKSLPASYWKAIWIASKS